ncbi:MAG: hypothetical protein R3B06_23535 [Kofleriaceae bacterium]
MELARRLVGVPQVEQTTTSSVSAGMSVAGARRGPGGVAVGGLSGRSGTVTRTHCVQPAEIDYVQDVAYTPELKGRTPDLIGGGFLVVLGVSLLASRHDDYVRERDLYRQAPLDLVEPSAPIGSYLVNAAIAAGGAALGIRAWRASGRPAPRTEQRRWTETTFVEASGCGLVPADLGSTAPTPTPGPSPLVPSTTAPGPAAAAP